ncbi:T9SS type A sorting domain-containing protein [Halpernia sp.]|uniref:T9SS type A sorting domain-containing protein n=1 Tax=Halpernia sp. TaxID=2782209 RepID=UPI003A8E1A51
MKKLYSLLAIAMFSVAAIAQTTTLAEYTFASLAGGTNDYGTSPLTATTTDPSLTVGGLTRGSGIGTTGSGAAAAWGGNDFTSTDAASAITSNEFATFTITVKTDYKVSLATISKYNIRRSGTGPTSGQWQYQIGAGSFVNIGSAITWGSGTNSSGNEQAAIDLNAISALQNLAAGTVVTFRILVFGASATGGTWYINSKGTSKTLTVLGKAVDLTLAVGDLNSTKVSLVKNTSVNNTITFGAKANVQIVNANGQVVKSANVENGTALDVSTLRKGMYIVTATVDGKRVSQKILKN